MPNHYPQKDIFLIHNAILIRLTEVRYFIIIVLWPALSFIEADVVLTFKVRKVTILKSSEVGIKNMYKYVRDVSSNSM